MPDPTTEFFDGLGRRGHEPLLQAVTGTMWFDIEHDDEADHWLLVITKGDLHVSREERDADCVIRTSRVLFDRFVNGKAHIYAAWVRNEVKVQGDIRLARFFQRVLPGPPGAHHPRTFVAERRRRA